MASGIRNNLSTVLKVVVALSVIGAINWGLVGFFNWNLVNAIFGGDTHSAASALSRLIYCLVGIAGLATAFMFPWGAREQLVSRTPTGIHHRRADVRP